MEECWNPQPDKPAFPAAAERLHNVLDTFDVLTNCCGECRFGKIVPDEVKQLVEECWDPQPHKRPAFPAIAERLQKMFDAMPADRKKKCTIM